MFTREDQEEKFVPEPRTAHHNLRTPQRLSDLRHAKVDALVPTSSTFGIDGTTFRSFKTTGWFKEKLVPEPRAAQHNLRSGRLSTSPLETLRGASFPGYAGIDAINVLTFGVFPGYESNN